MVGFARSATGPCCRQYRRDQRPGCIGQICIVELVDIVFNSHHTTIICTRKRLFKHPLTVKGHRFCPSGFEQSWKCGKPTYDYRTCKLLGTKRSWPKVIKKLCPKARS